MIYPYLEGTINDGLDEIEDWDEGLEEILIDHR
jgi:hypothetical protein